MFLPLLRFLGNRDFISGLRQTRAQQNQQQHKNITTEVALEGNGILFMVYGQYLMTIVPTYIHLNLLIAS
jgi:uncharacterized protein YqhQ